MSCCAACMRTWRSAARTARTFVWNAARSANWSFMVEAAPGSTAVDPGAASTMKDQLADLAAFQTKVRAVRAADRQVRMQAAQQLIDSDGKPPGTYPVALALVKLLCDCASNAADWGVVLAFGSSLPDEFA